MHSSERRLRVLLCAPNLHRGGAERMSLLLLEALDRRYFDVTMYVQERLESQYVPRTSLSADIIYGAEGSYKRRHLFTHLSRMIGLSRKADVVIGVSEGRASALALIAGLANRLPVVLWIHADWSRFSNVVSWRTRLALTAFGRAAAIVAPSDGVARAHAGCFPKNHRLLHVIPNMIDLAAIRASVGETIPTQFQSVFDKKTVLAVGRLAHEKGFDLLLRSHAKVRQMGADHALVILGVGDERAALEELASDLDVSDSVHFLGFQDNPYKFMARATAFVLSSRFEGFGLVVAEALACGTPVISFDCPSGPAEILEGGRFGILVPPEDVDGLAREIFTLLHDPQRQRELADRGRGRAQDFDIETFGAAWQRLLRSVTRRTHN